jgi:hypothetical protein
VSGDITAGVHLPANGGQVNASYVIYNITNCDLQHNEPGRERHHYGAFHRVGGFCSLTTIKLNWMDSSYFYGEVIGSYNQVITR